MTFKGFAFIPLILLQIIQTSYVLYQVNWYSSHQVTYMGKYQGGF